MFLAIVILVAFFYFRDDGLHAANTTYTIYLDACFQLSASFDIDAFHFIASATHRQL